MKADPGKNNNNFNYHKLLDPKYIAQLTILVTVLTNVTFSSLYLRNL